MKHIQEKLSRHLSRNVYYTDTAAPIALTFDGEIKKTQHKYPPNIQHLGVVISNKCWSQCAHCYNNSSPNGNLQLVVDDITRLADYLFNQNHSLISVGISGGEPFIFPELPDLINKLKTRQLYVTCSTGGVGVNIQRIKDAVTAGLDGIVFSWDEYHNKYRDEEQLFTLINDVTCLVKRIKLSITIKDFDEIEDVCKYLGRNVKKKVDFHIHPIIPIGRASRLKIKTTTNKFECSKACGREFHSISLNYDGNVYACCSIASFQRHLKLFHVDDIPLSNGLNQLYKTNATLRSLATVGIESMLMRKNNLSINKCTICQQLSL